MTLNDCKLSELMWMAPEMLKMNSKTVSQSKSKITLKLLLLVKF